MKKITSIFLALFMLALLPHTCAYADKTVSVEGTDLWLTLPDDMLVITLATDTDDEVWGYLDMNPDEALEMMRDIKTYMYAYPQDFSGVLYVTCRSDNGTASVYDFSLYDDETVLSSFSDTEEIAHDASSLMEDTGIEAALHDVSLYEHNGIKYVRYMTEFTYEGDVFSGQCYCTMYNGCSVQIIYQSYVGELSAEDLAFLQSVVDGAVYAPRREPAEPTLADEMNESPQIRALKAAFDPGSILTDAIIGAIIGGGVYAVTKLTKRGTNSAKREENEQKLRK